MRQKRAVLSVVLLFMLALITIGPNQNSYHGQLFSPVFSPLFAVTEFGSTWSFFAPDPSTLPVRLEWEILDERGEVVRDGYFPATGFPYFFNERQTRRIALARFFYFADDKHLNVWSNWLCRSNPDAKGIRLWKSNALTPDLYRVQRGEQSLSDIRFEERQSVGNVFCDPVMKLDQAAERLINNANQTSAAELESNLQLSVAQTPHGRRDAS
ncbi:MAG: hypothetical protein H7301_09870 [Cryobacterium sp.]|nr:hypothetical protein [Oligoflexia bacterium]